MYLAVVIFLSSATKLDRKNLVYDPAEQEYGLLPQPIHVGKYLREKRVDFQLPYDILWLQERGLVRLQFTVYLFRITKVTHPVMQYKN